MLKFASFPLSVAALAIGSSAGLAHPVEEDEPSAAEETAPEEPSEAPAGPYVVERDVKGQVTKVRIGDRIVDVCTAEKQDSCINPRDAGLDQGRREIDYWPGKPASEIEEPLPLEKPAPELAEEPAEQPSVEPEQG